MIIDMVGVTGSSPVAGTIYKPLVIEWLPRAFCFYVRWHGHLAREHLANGEWRMARGDRQFIPIINPTTSLLQSLYFNYDFSRGYGLCLHPGLFYVRSSGALEFNNFE